MQRALSIIQILHDGATRIARFTPNGLKHGLSAAYRKSHAGSELQESFRESDCELELIRLTMYKNGKRNGFCITYYETMMEHRSVTYYENDKAVISVKWDYDSSSTIAVATCMIEVALLERSRLLNRK